MKKDKRNEGIDLIKDDAKDMKSSIFWLIQFWKMITKSCGTKEKIFSKSFVILYIKGKKIES